MYMPHMEQEGKDEAITKYPDYTCTTYITYSAANMYTLMLTISSLYPSFLLSVNQEMLDIQSMYK